MSSWVDTGVLLIYVAGVVGLGCCFAFRNRSSNEFMAAGGKLPGWAIGLSLFGTFLSSNTFIGNPGKAFGQNWSFFVFSLTVPIGAWIAATWFVPFYRKSGNISAYDHLEKRFGSWARIYTVVFYLLLQVTRAGTILLGVSIGMHAVTGWDLQTIICVTGVLVTAYTLIGGIEAVIWTDVVQSIVLGLGALVIVSLLFFDPASNTIFQAARDHDKFSLGDSSFDLGSPTILVIFLFGVFINLTNFGIDQNYIQRYHAAESTSAARKSLWIGALTYVPVSAMFFLIGSLLFGFYDSRPDELLEIEKMALESRKNNSADFALPHFMANHLPIGLGGLMIAALFSAAISTVDTSLNSSATITLCDIFRKTGKGNDERARMRVLRYSTLFWGCVGTITALAMSYDSRSLLKIWWDLSAIFSGAMLGLFLLGFVSPRAGNRAAQIGVAGGLLVIFWMSFSNAKWMPEFLNSPFDKLMTTVIGTMVVFGTGSLCSFFQKKAPVTRPPH